MRSYFSLVTFSHTVFALPFAIIGFTLAVLQDEFTFSWQTLVLVLGCMLFARNAAMAFNRLVDAPIDAANARTAIREIPSGVINKTQARIFVIVNCLLFIACTAGLNLLCLALSPVALLVILGYSYTKRFTWLCHIILGIGLALAPIGAYLAVTGEFALLPCLFGVVVLLWVAGFDIIYALQDEQFDKGQGLQSIPTRFGSVSSLRLSRAIHFFCLVVLSVVSVILSQDYPNALIFIYLSLAAFAVALVYQHSIVRPNDLSNINRAFFTTNGLASIVYASILVCGISLS